MRKQKSHSRVVTTSTLALVLFASWFALPAPGIQIVGNRRQAIVFAPAPTSNSRRLRICVIQ